MRKHWQMTHSQREQAKPGSSLERQAKQNVAMFCCFPIGEMTASLIAPKKIQAQASSKREINPNGLNGRLLGPASAGKHRALGQNELAVAMENQI